MPHSIILIRSAIDNLKGNATTGSVNTLRTSVDGLQDGFENGDVPTATACHEQLDSIQDWLTGTTVYDKESPGETVDRFNTESDTILNP